MEDLNQDRNKGTGVVIIRAFVAFLDFEPFVSPLHLRTLTINYFYFFFIFYYYFKGKRDFYLPFWTLLLFFLLFCCFKKQKICFRGGVANSCWRNVRKIKTVTVNTHYRDSLFTKKKKIVRHVI